MGARDCFRCVVVMSKIWDGLGQAKQWIHNSSHHIMHWRIKKGTPLKYFYFARRQIDGQAYNSDNKGTNPKLREAKRSPTHAKG